MTEQYTPDNPAMGGIDTGLEYHPNRKDFEQSKTVKGKVKTFLRRVTELNDGVHFGGGGWTILFCVWWVGMLLVNTFTYLGFLLMWTRYGEPAYSSQIGAAYNLFVWMLIWIFPIYVTVYATLVFIDWRK